MFSGRGMKEQARAQRTFNYESTASGAREALKMVAKAFRIPRNICTYTTLRIHKRCDCNTKSQEKLDFFSILV
ncbi:hypothetical protein QG37_01780 [Candidozyma auris]|uniref:Uncharacterized protein n=1 Tax=Candidozyma auris TaxID=498019 RepID=A0A0L0P3U1_CANAR|nr:hypothetical protein QG37_01780 [[Candida] auris]